MLENLNQIYLNQMEVKKQLGKSESKLSDKQTASLIGPGTPADKLRKEPRQTQLDEEVLRQLIHSIWVQTFLFKRKKRKETKEKRTKNEHQDQPTNDIT